MAVFEPVEPVEPVEVEVEEEVEVVDEVDWAEATPPPKVATSKNTPLTVAAPRRRQSIFTLTVPPRSIPGWVRRSLRSARP